MNKQLIKLVSIANATSRKIIGLMSGTSLDGLDIALCEFEGAGRATKIKLLEFVTLPYTTDFKEQLKLISFKEQVALEQVTLMNASFGRHTAAAVLEALTLWGLSPAAIDVIASHGQTIFHAPVSFHQQKDLPNATLQIGDGDHIALLTGIITLSDFRQKHIAAGGEGAPLAVYGDYLLCAGKTENRILLNIGGISNFSYLPAEESTAELFSTDAGPGNTIMDQFIQKHYPGKYYDDQGTIAAAGKLNEVLVKQLLDHPFFSEPFPKTTGPELFNLTYLLDAQAACGQQLLSDEDVMATLCEFTARSIILAIQKAVKNQSFEVYLSGGGMHNDLLVQKLAAGLGKKLNTTDSLGINPDAKEAVLFALLANECLAGGDTDFGKGTGLLPITMGKISLP